MAIRNMTEARIRKALQGMDLAGVDISRNNIDIQVMDDDWVDYDATQSKAKSVQEKLGEGWLWTGNGSIVFLSYDPHGELHREHEASMRDQLGPAYDAA